MGALDDELTGRARTALFVLLGISGLVLLIASANVANMLLARHLKIQQEMALRIALGAGRARLVRQMLTESVILAVVAGAVGIPMAFTVVRFLVDFAARYTTRAAEIAMDLPVLVFSATLSIGVGLLFGVWPALVSSRGLSRTVHDSGARTTTGRTVQRLRGGLVVAQVAVSLMVLIGAGLLGRSFVKLQRVDPGANIAGVLTMRLSPNYTRLDQPGDLTRLGQEVLRIVGDVPGVEWVALTNSFPFRPGAIANGPDRFGLEIVGQARTGPETVVDADMITPDYFQVIGQSILAGRIFADQDIEGAPQVAVVNETMARTLWGGASPLGARLRSPGSDLDAEVVGVVSDVREYGLDRPVVPKLYLPMAQNGFANQLVVRTGGPAEAVVSGVRAALRELDRELAVDRVATLEALRDESVASPRLMTTLVGLFALLALLISAGGIASVMALVVSQRTNELGIRMTLGASRGEVLAMVAGHGLRLALTGAGIGLLGAMAFSRLVASQLYDITPTDPLTFVSVAAFFLVVATFACLIPARRATTIDPMRALRHD